MSGGDEDGVLGDSENLVVAGDGTGTHRTLLEALGDARSGTTIYLEAGTHDVTRGCLPPDAPVIGGGIQLIGVRLEGQGSDRTEIVSSFPGTVLALAGGSLRHLTVRSTAGTQQLDDFPFLEHTNAPLTLVAIRGRGTIEWCRITGAHAGRRGSIAGVHLGAATEVRITDCIFDDNDDGIIVAMPCRELVLERNLCTGNRDVGIGFVGVAYGAAVNNNCSDNGTAGILVAGSSIADLRNNTCSKNRGNGIAYEDRAAGPADGNACTENSGFGIAVDGEAGPHLQANMCLENKKSGIGYFTDGGGHAQGNVCANNAANGFELSGDTSPRLERNHCVSNAEAGIAYFEHAKGIARYNFCSLNGKMGIYIGDEAIPAVASNRCDGNRVGIQVVQAAVPELIANRCERSDDSGMVFALNAAGRALRNICTGNDCGLYLAGNADPLLQGNILWGNRVSDLEDDREG